MHGGGDPTHQGTDFPDILLELESIQKV